MDLSLRHLILLLLFNRRILGVLQLESNGWNDNRSKKLSAYVLNLRYEAESDILKDFKNIYLCV